MTIWDRRIQKYAGVDIPSLPDTSGPPEVETDIFWCPKDAYPRPFGRRRSYSMLFFNFYDGPGGNMDYLEPVPIDLFPVPAESFLSSEWHTDMNVRLWNRPPCIIFHWYYLCGDTSAPGPAPMDGRYHGQGNNFLFVDAHAARMSPAEAWTGDPSDYWNWGMNP
jgi:prepilin-type processing-associated H-X9-DG protein